MIHDYLYNYPNYSFYIKLIKKFEKKYLKQYNKLYSKYQDSLFIYDENNYLKLMKNKRQLDIKYIKKIISKFNKIIDKDIVIFFHGSYSKKLNRWNSDIDINFLYLNDVDKNSFVLEELIVCAIYKVFNLSGRDKIHTMMLYLPNEYNFTFDLSDNYYIKFNDGNVFNYKCRKNFKSIYPKILYSSRKYKDFYDYIRTRTIQEEWISSYEGLKTKDIKIINSLLMEQNNYLKSNKNIYFKFLKKFKAELIYTNINNVEKVCEFNKIIKVHNLNKIYNMLLILKEFIILKNGRCLNLDINKIKNNRVLKKYLSIDLLNKFFESLYKYIWFLDKIENLCLELNINFSSREISFFNIKEFRKKYNIYYKSVFIKDYECYKQFINVSKKVLRRIQEI